MTAEGQARGVVRTLGGGRRRVVGRKSGKPAWQPI